MAVYLLICMLHTLQVKFSQQHSQERLHGVDEGAKPIHGLSEDVVTQTGVGGQYNEETDTKGKQVLGTMSEGVGKEGYMLVKPQ